MVFPYPMKVPIPYGSYDGFPSSYGSYGYDGLPLSIILMVFLYPMMVFLYLYDGLPLSYDSLPLSI